MLRREGIKINHKRTYRLYKAAGLALKKRSKKKYYEKRGMPERAITEANARWSMDFVTDRTRYGSNIRVLTVIDEVTRECLALEVDSSMTGREVTAVLNRIAIFRGLPQEIITDNGSEFTSNVMNAWAYDHRSNTYSLTQASQYRTVILKALTESSGQSALTRTGSKTWRKRRKSLKTGDWSTTTSDRIRH
jgi:transposase InsO family protein